MNTDAKIELIKGFAEEIVTEEELRNLFETKKHPVAYDGFEPSGNMHIAQGIMRTINVNTMTKVGCKFKMLVADWHAWANNKMDGDLEKIQKGGEYLIEVWKASGLTTDQVEFVWASDFMDDEEYWKKVMSVARHSTVKRIIRCSQIMGRSESDALNASQIFYPCMQAADIFHLNVDICQLGMDQRKVNMLAKEIGEKIGYWNPVSVSHHMLMGLQHVETGESGAERAIAMKMSKSKPDTAIFMTDSEEDIKRKISKAFCPEKQVKDNPILEYLKFLVFQSQDSVTLERPAKFGGDVMFSQYSELEKEYLAGKIHPMDLKNTAGMALNNLIAPVRKHFEKNKKAAELKEFVESQKVTR